MSDNNMKNRSACTRTITTRLSENQYQHIKSQQNPSCYLRLLIERDLSQVVQDEES